MPDIQQAALSNLLLKALSGDDFARLGPHLLPLSTVMHQVVIEANVPARQLFFPENGFVSITTGGARQIEVGLIGREGLVGAVPVLLGTDRTPYRQFVQSPGVLLAIDAQVVLSATEESPTLRRVLMGFVLTLMTQTTQTAFVNATLNIEPRLARWLLMCQDRVGDEIALTHEFLSIMLGVQRTSVTSALQSLEGHGLIRARRGRVMIRDRDRLKGLAGEGYGLPEAEHRRLIGSAA